MTYIVSGIFQVLELKISDSLCFSDMFLKLTEIWTENSTQPSALKRRCIMSGDQQAKDQWYNIKSSNNLLKVAIYFQKTKELCNLGFQLSILNK